MKNLKSSTFKCEACRDTTWIEGKDGVYHRCKCYAQELAKKSWLKSGITPEQSNLTFNTFRPWNKASEDTRKLGIKYAKSFKEIKDRRCNSMSILGQVGSGKTHVCMATSLYLLQQGVQVIYMPYREVITFLKQTIKDEETYQRETSKLKTAELLYIDDLFKGKITESDKNIMFEIINSRYINNMPLIVSSEHNADGLMEIDDAVGSRIIEMSKDFLMIITGKDNNYRLRGIL